MDSFFIKYNQSYLKVEFGHCADCVHFAWMTNGLDIKNILIAIFNIGFWWPSSPFLERPWAVYQTFFDLLKFFSNPLLLSHSRGAPPMVVNLYPIRWANPSAPQYKSIIMYSINWVRGAIKMHFRKKLGIWPNQRTPLPPPRKLSLPKKKKKFNVYFAF